MAIYMVGYDLNKFGKNYEGLTDRLKQFGTRWHQLDSTWIIDTTWTAAQIRDDLRPYLDSDDELLVVGLKHEAAWFGFNAEGSNWLLSHL